MKRLALIAAAAMGFVAVASPDTLLVVGGTPANRMVFDNLAEHGFAKQRSVKAEDLTSADLASAKLVVFCGGGQNYALTQWEKELKKSIVEYVRAGGGLVIVNGLGQMLSPQAFKVLLMEDFGGDVLMAAPVYPDGRQIPLGDRKVKYAYTDRVTAPFDDGVANVIYHADNNLGTMSGIWGCKGSDDWRVVLTAGSDVGAKRFRELGAPFYDDRAEKVEEMSGDYPIVAVREFGKGRVCWFGIYHNIFTLDTTKGGDAVVIMSQVLKDGIAGHPKSDTNRFIQNIFAWTAAKSAGLDAAAIPELKSLAAYEASLDTTYRAYKGVIGPRTSYSSGKSTVAEYVAKAKSLGLDFIAFLEEFERLTPENYEKLRLECESFTDDKFTAWAGYTIQKEDGNREYVFSDQPVYPGRKFLTPDGKRMINHPGGKSASSELVIFYGIQGFKNNVGWYMFHESPYRAADTRAVQSMALFTRVNGKTAETALDVYKLNTRNGQQLQPLALELMDSADGLDENTYRCYMYAEGVAVMRKRMMSHGLSSGYPDQGCYGCQGVTSGPIVEFKLNRGDCEDDGKRLYNRKLYSWDFTLDVASENGVGKVLLLDGDTVVRRWDGNGEKKFSIKGALTNERQHYYWICARDTAGGEAVTRPVNSNTFLLRDMQCSDRENQMLYSNQKRDGCEPPMIASHGGDTCLSDKGPWNGRVRPVGFFVFDGKWGMGGDGGFDGSPEDHPQVNFAPCIKWGDKKPASLGWVSEFVAGKSGGAHVLPRRIVSSGNALVADRVLDGCFPLSQRDVVHVWHSLFPVEDCPYAETTARCSLFLPKIDGVIPYQWDQALRLKTEFPTSGAGEPLVCFGRIRKSKHTVSVNAHLGGSVIPDAYSKTFDMAKGDYIVLKDSVWGSMAVYALAPVKYVAGALWQAFDGDIAPAGTTFRFRMAMVGMHRGVTDPDAYAQEVKEKYAEFTPDGVIRRRATRDGAVVEKFDGLKDLPGTLGYQLAGLSDNRSAVVAVPDDMRIVPVEKGTAYVALGNEESGKEVFIGHPFVCNNADLGIYLSRTGRDLGQWQMELHNPTAKEIKAKVKNDPRFNLITLEREVTIPAYTSTYITIQYNANLK